MWLFCVTLHCAFLLLYTLSSAGIFSCFNSFYNTKSVVICLGITVAVCLLVTIFSFQTKVRKIWFFFFCKCCTYGWQWKSLMGSSLSRCYLHLISCALSIQLDVTSYQGVLFVFCMVMFISGLVLAVVLPFQYVSATSYYSSRVPCKVRILKILI